jgi:hypothetical protein
MMNKGNTRIFSTLDLVRISIVVAWVAISVTLAAILIPTGQQYVETQPFLQKYMIVYSCFVPVIIIFLAVARKMATKEKAKIHDIKVG